MPKYEPTEKKMTLEEYEDNYNAKPYNTKTVKTFLFVFAAGIGIIIFTCLLITVLKLFDIHMYAGVAGAVVAAFLFVFLYIVPLVKLTKTKAFMTTVDASNAHQAKKWNKALREEIADKMIDFHTQTTGTCWYSDENVGKLAIARQTNNDKMLKEVLTQTYDTDVKKASAGMIRDAAIKVGIITGVSQSGTFDTAIVCMYELNLIKRLVLLYGYRPNDAQMVRIYKNVMADALIAYGTSAATTGLATGIINKVGGSFKNVPLFGLIGTAAESATQGIVNATLTVIIGIQTKHYLKHEYKLQDILDNVELEDEIDEASQEEMMAEVKTAISNKDKKPVTQAA